MFSDPVQQQAENLCCNITYLRRAHGLTKKEMALTLGIGVRSLDMIEKGQIPKTLYVLHLHMMACLFGVSVKRLLTEHLEEAVTSPTHSGRRSSSAEQSRG